MFPSVKCHSTEALARLDRQCALNGSLMNTISWQAYPLVDQTELARTWLETQSWLQLAPKTIDAYGRSLNDFLGFCMKHAIQPEQVTREQVALYVQDLATRPNPKGANILAFPTGRGLSNSTMQQRITVSGG